MCEGILSVKIYFSLCGMGKMGILRREGKKEVITL